MKVLDPEPLMIVNSKTDMPAGINVFDNFSVPVGGLYLLTHTAFIYIGTVAGVVAMLRLYNGVRYINLERFTFAVSAVPQNKSLNILMGSGWALNWYISGVTLNDDFECTGFVQQLR